MVVISHKYKFVFIKTHKTAGTSVEVSLSNLLPATDIISEIFPGEESHEPRNYLYGKTVLFYNHMSADLVRTYLGGKSCGYYFWAIERHPILKSLSYFAMIKNSPHHSDGFADLSFSDFVDRDDLLPTEDHLLYTNNGRLACHKIIDYDSLNEEVSRLMKTRFGVKDFGITSRSKSGFRNQSNIPSVQEMSGSDKVKIMCKFWKSTLLLKEQAGIDFDYYP